jgi:hypothetical protein
MNTKPCVGCSQPIDAALPHKKYCFECADERDRVRRNKNRVTRRKLLRAQQKIDYAVFGEAELLSILGDDASKWAAAFCQAAAKLGHRLDEQWMTTWFANAIETAKARIEA